MKKNEYQCATCHRIFEHGWSEAEAMAEFKRDFPTVPLDDTALICDYCYEALQRDIKENPWKYPGPVTRS